MGKSYHIASLFQKFRTIFLLAALVVLSNCKEIEKETSNSVETEMAITNEMVIWHIKTIHPDGRLIDVKAIDKDGNIFDVKAIQNTKQTSFMDIKALVGNKQLPVKLLVSGDKYTRVKALADDGSVYDIKALTPEGDTLDVKGVSRTKNIIHIKAISKA
ncbi:MAG: hypothetical protein WBM92_07880, partial [Aureibaculum sp.]